MEALGDEQLAKALLVEVEAFKFKCDWLAHNSLFLCISHFREQGML